MSSETHWRSPSFFKIGTLHHQPVMMISYIISLINPINPINPPFNHHLIHHLTTINPPWIHHPWASLDDRMLVAAGDGSLVTFLVSDGLLELSEIKAQGKEAGTGWNPREIHGKSTGNPREMWFLYVLIWISQLSFDDFYGISHGKSHNPGQCFIHGFVFLNQTSIKWL